MMNPRLARLGSGLLLLAAVIAASRALPWWACDLACSGPAAWSRPFGIEIAFLAAGLLAAAGILGWHTSTRPAGRMLAAMAAAGALVYLGLSLHLRLVCDHCLATHIPTLLGAGLLLAGADRRQAVAAVLIGLGCAGLLTARLIHIAPAPPPVTNQAAPDQALTAAIETGRTWGSGPITVEVGLDPHCPRCAVLASELAALPVRVVVRFVGNDASGRELAALLTAAAADGAPTLRSWMGLVLGTADGVGWADLRGRVAESLDPRAAESRAASAAAIVSADRAFLAGLLGRDPARPLQTPVVVVRRPDGDRVLRGADIGVIRKVVTAP